MRMVEVSFHVLLLQGVAEWSVGQDKRLGIPFCAPSSDPGPRQFQLVAQRDSNELDQFSVKYLGSRCGVGRS